MAKTVRIPLPEPILSHGAPITAVVLREPTYDEYVSCGGEPYTIGETEEGALFSIEKPEVIWAYVQACIVEPKDALLLERTDWRVAREVRKAVLGFFQAPAAASASSQTSPTT
ncbi:hypothetical protein ASF28_08925 [Methylobacterium sp. Leaf99]|uniref:hypothetical protein n=1 Tax=Methylobacterium sp. Leaf99 TaxID=1736251 RepID=UPI0006F6EA9E|nr:hypothetical protein [Methylobacterium sp. Leaf99]KQP11156.1 hypothetical protein ASF28_08925 [Methylobacterium sp. Leaf99]